MKRTSYLLLFIILLVVSVSTTGAAAAKPPVLFGVYPGGSLQTAAVIDKMISMDAWLSSNGASEIAIAGDFISITLNPAYNVEHELAGAWDNGYIPFVNLMPSAEWEANYGYYQPGCATSERIAAGDCDDYIAIWATEYKRVAGTNKMAYIAPLPEANGDWALYSTTGPIFVDAFRRIQDVFADAGVLDSTVKWVFAPNGWHDSEDNDWRKFENYYPGDAYVDVVAFSSYNYGGCPDKWADWSTYQKIFEPYLLRMTAMAPSKPIFIAQTGTVGVPVNPEDPTQNKDDWVRDVFSDLANYPNLDAIIYFNIAKAEGLPNCPLTDFRLYDPDTNPPIQKQGLIDILSDPRFGDFTFADVQNENVWYYDAVHTIYDHSITTGCSENPLMYCPDNPVTRAQMALFLLKSKYGSSYSPPTATGTMFDDVPGSSYDWAAAWIENLATDGITSGCGNENYCPEQAVTRAQMALFLLKSKYGSSYHPPEATGTMFDDVPGNYYGWAAAWIEQLATEGITSGCGDKTYCPEQAVTRAQMAVFLVRTFNLP